jgi:cob(I)alamin adenosyltransferase
MTAFKKFDSEWGRFFLGHFLTLAIFASIHFGDGRYVTKADYTADMKSVRDTLVSLDKSIALLETTRRVQDDHEARLRALEARKVFYEKNQTPSLTPVLPGGDLFAAARPR